MKLENVGELFRLNLVYRKIGMNVEGTSGLLMRFQEGDTIPGSF